MCMYMYRCTYSMLQKNVPVLYSYYDRTTDMQYVLALDCANRTQSTLRNVGVLTVCTHSVVRNFFVLCNLYVRLHTYSMWLSPCGHVFKCSIDNLVTFSVQAQNEEMTRDRVKW